MKINKNILICKGVRFYSPKDEAAFFEWIKKIDCIENISAASDELYLEITSIDLHDSDLRELLALFHRYQIDMKQLSIFLNKANKKWFFNNKKAFWHGNVFGLEK